MEFAGVLRALITRRALVCLGVALALAVGVLATHRVSLSPPTLEARETGSAFARARVLVDTPHSLIAAVRPRGYSTVATRAALLGSTIADDGLRRAIAGRAGLRGSEVGVDAYMGVSATPTPLSKQALEAARSTEPERLTVSVENPQVPIVSILAEAPTPRAAARLAGAATSTLESLASRPAGDTGGVNIKRLGSLTVGRAAGGSNAAKAGLAAVAVLLLWCAGVVVLDSVLRRRAYPPVAAVRDQMRPSHRAAADSS